MKRINYMGKNWILGILAMASWQASEAKEKMNVLFIMVDDLRPELGCYGQQEIISPNIDQLASEGTLFQRAYCNVPVSGASRASLLTGMRPTRDHFYRFDAWVKEDTPAAEVLPETFKKHNYLTISNSKIFHHATDHKKAWNKLWLPKGKGSWRNYIDEDNLSLDKKTAGNSTEMLDVEDEAYFDGKTAEKTIKDLQSLKKSGKPFFMAVGFLKPHLPFNAPKKYWDMYDRNQINLPENFKLLNNSIPNKAFHTFGELRAYNDMPSKGDVSAEDAKKLIHGYRACVSYTDTQVGKVLNELKNLDLEKNTIVVLLGDHGWSLGEHGLWCKHSSFNTCLNAPLIIKVPGIKSSRTNNIVEFIDIYPTLCELTDIEKPRQLEGESLLSLIKGEKNKREKDYAVCKWELGLTYIHEDYFYTEWSSKDSDTTIEKMLFDHTTDRNENINIAEKEKNEELIISLSKELRNKRGVNY